MSLATWKKVVFIAVLVTFIGLSVFLTFSAIARDPFEFERQTNVGKIEGLDGWVFFGFNGNALTTTVRVDYVRDKKGDHPDASKPVVGVDAFTVVSDEYVEYIYIGKDVRYISEQAFYYCKALKAVFVDDENRFFTCVDGCLYSKDKTVLLLHPIRNGDWLKEKGLAQTNDAFDVPRGVARLGAFCFYKCASLVHLTLPETLRDIGDMAFFGCNGLWSVWLPEGLETVGSDAFSYCWSMSPVMYIPSSVTSIGHHAFFSCSGLSVFYMGARRADGIALGEAWLPKSLKTGIAGKTPKPVYGKTLDEALAEKRRIDGESA